MNNSKVVTLIFFASLMLLIASAFPNYLGNFLFLFWIIPFILFLISFILIIKKSKKDPHP